VDENGLLVHRRIEKLTAAYLSFLARYYPVMCASDEFYFMPRAEEACLYYGSLDSLEKSAIQECVNRLNNWKTEVERMLEQRSFQKIDLNDFDQRTLDDYTDLQLLKSSMCALLIEFEHKRSWAHNPLLYLKVAFIGLDHALGKPASTQTEVWDRAEKRLRALPKLLKHAEGNLDAVPVLYVRGGLDMIGDCSAYLEAIGKELPEKQGLGNAFAQCSRALDSFREHLEQMNDGSQNPSSRQELLCRTLRDHFQINADTAMIMEVARGQWESNLQQLKEMERRVGLGKSWLELYESMQQGLVQSTEILNLYRSESSKLRNHFDSLLPFAIETEPCLLIRETPRYLRSIRGSASFSAAFSGDEREHSFFYITTHLPQDGENKRLSQRLHREYLFLTAHETYPGHHLLDHVRRRMTHPLRRQIESPLFYEGWATYAESLLLETGYVGEPSQKIVFHKRNLWRAARCMVDIGLTSGLMGMEESQQLLVSSGFSAEEAVSQIRRFLLNPGYQLCYSLGLHEILNLRDKYGTLLGNDRFHQLFLGGGELPFSLVGLRLQNLV
jgi:hypothetical protein